MMQLLLYQINWPTILDLESAGTGSSSHPILLLCWGNFCVFHKVLEILESDLFQDNFAMALYSFGGVSDQCGATLCHRLVQCRGNFFCFLSGPSCSNVK